jgi:uncharacterized protein YraI
VNKQKYPLTLNPSPTRGEGLKIRMAPLAQGLGGAVLTRIMIFVFCMIWFALPAHAQEATPEPTPAAPETSVYVTTQDFVSLREGPGQGFDRIAVVPAAVTLPAIGRTAETLWVQVWYNGVRGWISQRYLVWSGNIVNLPVDGIDPVPYVRLIGVLGITTRETNLYARQVAPSDQVGTIPPATIVELTARLGTEGYIQYQIRHEGQLYWVGSWDIRIINGSYLSLLDTTYLYPYGRLVTQLGRDIRDGQRSLSQIEDIWVTLGTGQGISCARVPRYARREITDTDVNQEEIFRPAAIALDGAIAEINTAISLFADACSRAQNEAGFFLTQQDVEAALLALDNARRNLNLSQSLLNALAPRDPLVGRLRNEDD